MKNWAFDDIIDYFEEKLPAEEVEVIDRLIAEKKDFASWIDELYSGWLKDPQHYREKVKDYQAQFFRKLDEISQQEGRGNALSPRPAGDVSPGGSKLRTYYKWMASAAAAAVLLLLIQSFGLWPGQCSLQDRSCFLESGGGIYLQGITKMATTDLNEEIQAAVNAYESARYAEAAGLLEPLLEEDLTPFQRNELRLLLGISHLMNNAPSQALRSLNLLIQTGPPPSQEEARWYAALAYLEQEDYPKATALLREVKEQGGTHAQTARRTLRRIWWR